FDNAASNDLVPAHLSLRHASVIAGEEPVFRLSNTRARAVVEDSVIAAAGTGKATLVISDEPGALDWLGRENLYGRIGVFLQPMHEENAVLRIASFTAWADSPGVIREIRSVATEAQVWAQANPKVLLEGRDSLRAYELAALAPNIGARQIPRESKPRFN